MRGGEARWDVRIELEAGGCLVWRGEPFVVADGADVLRTTTVDLAPGAGAVLRETLVLGRTGEPGGRLRTRTEVCRDGAPVLVEELDPPLGLGRWRVVDQVLELGATGGQEDRATDVMVLESGDRLQRWLGDELHRSPLGPQTSSPSPE